MAIVVDYGPIAGALGLAQQAGRGQGFAQQSQRDLQALQIQNSMQSEIDRTNATAMQDAMAQQNLQLSRQQQAQQLAQQQAYQRAQQSMEAQNYQANQQNQALTQQRLAEQEKSQQAYNLATLQQKGQLGQAALGIKQQGADTATQRTQNQADAEAWKEQNLGTGAHDLAVSKENANLLNNEISQRQTRQKWLEESIAKASDPLRGNPDVAKGLQDELNGIKFDLFGVDPATGKKVKAGLLDYQSQLRQRLEAGLGNDGTFIHPAGTNPAQLQMDSGAPVQGSPQQGGSQPGANTAVPQLSKEMVARAYDIARQRGVPVNDPTVTEQIRLEFP